MSLEQALELGPLFVLVVFRIAGMILVSPLFGSARVPRQVKLMFALVMSAGLVPGVAMPQMPPTMWQLALGLAGELVFGLAIGTALSFAFVAVHWAGEVIGQQMGFGLGQIYDPQFGQSGSVVSDLHFLLAMVIFLIVGGHYAFLRGVQETFVTLPLLSVGIDRALFDVVVGLLSSATALAIQLSAPVLVAMLVTDVVLGFLSKTVPQINVMSTGLSLRSIVGMVVLMFGIGLGSEVIGDAMMDSMKELGSAFAGNL